MADSSEQLLLARAHLEQSAALKLAAAEYCLDALVASALRLADRFRHGGRLYLCGNGGSAADCQHLATEFVSRLSSNRERPGLPALALTTDTSFLTAFSNDYGFDGVFARQVEALGRPGDVLLAISTSGASVSVLRGVRTARQLGLVTIALMGASGPLEAEVDLAIRVPSRDTQLIQEAHLALEHILCGLVEMELFGGPTRST